MAVRLYVVNDSESGRDFLVAAKTRDRAMDYVAKKVLQHLSAKPATPLQALRSGSEGIVVQGAPSDLAALGIGD